jgi:hypothetical protein
LPGPSPDPKARCESPAGDQVQSVAEPRDPNFLEFEQRAPGSIIYPTTDCFGAPQNFTVAAAELAVVTKQLIERFAERVVVVDDPCVELGQPLSFALRRHRKRYVDARAEVDRRQPAALVCDYLRKGRVDVPSGVTSTTNRISPTPRTYLPSGKRTCSLKG